MIAFGIPLFKLNFDIASILIVISLLFAILVGFFIAAATSNYLALQSLIAEEDAGLIAVYNYCRVIAPEISSRIVDAIDTYVIAALSFELTEYIGKTQKEFDGVSKAVEEINFNDERGKELIGLLYEKKNSLYQTRNSIDFVARPIITESHWFVLGSLAILADFLVLALRDGSLFSNIITGVLFIITYLTLSLLGEVDNDRFLEVAFFKDTERVFRAIGKPEYYTESVIKSGRVPEPKESYRTGYYNGPGDNAIKLVEKI